MPRAEIRFWVRNLTNEKEPVAAVYAPSADARYAFVLGAIRAVPPTGFAAFGALVSARPPRTFGVTISDRF